MPLQLPTRETSVYWYLGVAAGLARGSVEGSSDLGTDIELVARTNEYLVAGIGGEAIFRNVYLALFRSNSDTLQLSVTPVVDGVEYEAIIIDLEAVANPTRETLEVGLAVLYPSVANPQIATALRGEKFALEIRSVGTIPPGRFKIEGMELEWDVVTEGKEAVNAS